MGEEAKQEEVKAETKPEVEKKAEEKKEESKPPSPVVLFVDLHCVGCAKKIERSLMRYRDMAQNQITVKGVVDPQALCMLIQKKTKRRASVLSPMPAAEGEQPTPQLVTSQVSGLTTIELNVNMHWVQSAEADSVTSKVTVTGTMDAQHLVDYVYRRTKKQAQVVPQPEPPADPEPKPEPEKTQEKKEGDINAAEETPKAEEKIEENAEKAPEEENKSEDSNGGTGKDEKVDQSKEDIINVEELKIHEEIRNARMMYYYPPLYHIERIPPPQIFSDENPNACCIS
ncbi:Heavy metal-associated isoprenylated plant protein [Thalictrum thalictroides]|uniref:Heavy metal-associated isoprenylated plant protein n=1 Tax=Thalictrum thalictroides TaxID=46969 RepID=A0A7J6WN66_THATH|nr:Heavy metal-associated isoprenylated plant protein [Thalictrum thalictroides]